ncbi:hypothetical protein Fmac_011557 [Flemingia macrophylla]|uniref:Uncharacterized protein n=1 Tax=Flemingia macrophylla TaxID=520843 RepID=A0ABD1MN51_9FABA
MLKLHKKSKGIHRGKLGSDVGGSILPLGHLFCRNHKQKILIMKMTAIDLCSIEEEHINIASIEALVKDDLPYTIRHHSTSNDSTKYCQANAIEWWRVAHDPMAS